MAVPDYQSMMLPLLQSLSDNKSHTIKELFDRLAKHFDVSDIDLLERVPSGRETKFKNRVSWARTYLKKAALVMSPQRGQVRITVEGTKVLENKYLEKIDNVFLRQFEGFNKFRPGTTEPSSESDSNPVTPEEKLGEAYWAIQETLKLDLIESVKRVSPSFFERLVVDVMLAIGYGGNFQNSGIVTPQSNDQGIDGIINEDKLGLDVIYLQAKRWEKTVERPEIDKFIGALTRKGGRKGVFITTSRFSEGAKEAATGINISIVLINGEMLAQLMIEHDVGVSAKETYNVKQLDSQYFGDE